jgi:hypothetical protein
VKLEEGYSSNGGRGGLSGLRCGRDGKGVWEKYGKEIKVRKEGYKINSPIWISTGFCTSVN